MNMDCLHLNSFSIWIIWSQLRDSLKSSSTAVTGFSVQQRPILFLGTKVSEYAVVSYCEQPFSNPRVFYMHVSLYLLIHGEYLNCWCGVGMETFLWPWKILIMQKRTVKNYSFISSSLAVRWAAVSTVLCCCPPEILQGVGSLWMCPDAGVFSLMLFCIVIIFCLDGSITDLHCSFCVSRVGQNLPKCHYFCYVT